MCHVLFFKNYYSLRYIFVKKKYIYIYIEEVGGANRWRSVINVAYPVQFLNKTWTFSKLWYTNNGSMLFTRASQLLTYNHKTKLKKELPHHFNFLTYSLMSQTLHILYTIQNLQNIHQFFCLFGCNGMVCLKKDPKMYGFALTRFLILNLEKSEVIIFFLYFSVFKMSNEKMGPYLLCKTKS